MLSVLHRLRYWLLAVGLVSSIVATCLLLRDTRVVRWPTKGRVLFENGDPVRFGTVEFNSLERNLTARGAIDPDGNFVLTTFTPGDGAVAGRHRAIVVQFMVLDSPVQHRVDHGDLIDPLYFSPHTSRLEFQVEEKPQNEIVIKLRRKLVPEKSRRLNRT